MSVKAGIKRQVKQLLWTLHLDITRNMKYDRYAYKVFQSVLKNDSVCVDIGCHKGEILEWMLKFSPQGEHFAIEPIPYLFQQLQAKFTQSNVHLFNLALSDKAGRLNFTVVKNAPAYSGIKQRKYAVEHPELEIIEVDVHRLDELIPSDKKVRLIKLDVEGAELDVLKGATQLLLSSRPYVLFEFGLGSAEFYHASPEEMFALLSESRMAVFALNDWFSTRKALSQSAFVQHFNQNSEYYFLAVPQEEVK
jgi:FkbM family methyltransferase